MKHASYLVPHPIPTATPHAEECMEKIRAMLPKPVATDPPAEKPTEREPGSDDEETAW